MKNKRVFKRKYRVHITPRPIHKLFGFYFNKDSKHYFLSIANDGQKHDGHEMTTHPSLNKHGEPRKRYVELPNNPDPLGTKRSYIEKPIKKNIYLRYLDGQLRLRKRLIGKCQKRIKKYCM